jgi:hypothetical protein
MKKLLVTLVMLVCITQQVVSQSTDTIAENFDGNTVSFTAFPASAWGRDTNYYVSPPNAFLGTVPNMKGAITILESPVYDFYTGYYSNVRLRFKHICKISPRDTVQIEYKIRGMPWRAIPAATYLGASINYNARGFSANSYPEWLVGDSLAFPQASWWKEETFDVSAEVGLDDEVQFRFIIKHGAITGTQISYGWLLDDIKVIATRFMIFDPIVKFIAPIVDDTVYNTGPWEINAQVKTSTNAPIDNPWLKYTASHQGVFVASDSILMAYIGGDGQWRATIPQYGEGTKISYSVTGIDTFGNTATASSFYVIAYPPLKTTNYIYFGAYDTLGGMGNASIVLVYGAVNSWSRLLYLNSELQGISASTPTFLNAIAFKLINSPSAPRTSVRIYMQAVTQTTQPLIYSNPVTNGSTLVYQGPMSLVTSGWLDVAFQQTFLLPVGSNLMVYVEDDSPLACDYSWRGEATRIGNTGNMRVCGDSHIIGTVYDYGRKPVTRFGLSEFSFGDHSVELHSIDSPIIGQTTAGAATPIKITFRNKGDATITSLQFGWSLNGVVQPAPATWTGNLPWDYAVVQHTIASYTPRQGMYDTIFVWVKLPNTNQDTVRWDDTLSVVTYGCNAPLSGDYTVGSTGYFHSIADALNLMRLCTPVGDITLKMETGIYNEKWDFTNLDQQILGNHTLTITSSANHADSVILRAPSGIGITLDNTHNLALKALTVDAATSGSNGIQFTGACTNILVRDCRILVDTTTSVTSSAPVYKPTSSGIADSIFFINNVLQGGYYGLCFFGGTGTAAYGTHIVCDSNTVSKQYRFGIYFYYTDVSSCSYNTVLSRIANTGNDWYGIGLNYSNGPAIGNRVSQRSNSFTALSGITLSTYHFYNTTDTGLVANNEIYLLPTSNNCQGIYVPYAKANILHNSIYIAGTIGGRGIQIVDNVNNAITIKNNNIVLEATGAIALPIYFNAIANLSNYDMGYNNYYTNQYVGYIGGASHSMQTWQQAVPTDLYSVQILPTFVDVATSLDVADYTGLYCYRLAEVPDNIHKDIRTGYTTMGAYGIGLKDVYDLALTALIAPINTGGLCFPDYSPVRFKIENTGIIDHDFSVNPISLHFSVSAGLNVPAFDTLVLIDSGSLARKSAQEFELIDLFDVSHIGAYNITGWITNSLDTILANDTIRTIYYTKKINLPVDENFSNGLPAEFETKGDNSPAIWTVIPQGIGTDAVVVPVFGTAMLSFTGSRGAVSTMYTPQMDLIGSIQPVVSFWYFHDTLFSSDYMDVRITTDGVDYSTLFSLTKYDAVYGWKEYSMNLPSDAISQCVVLVFEAMEKSNGNVTQYIDRIRITARQDVVVHEIRMQEVSVCDLQNKELKVVINTATNHPVDLSGSQLAVEIPGYSGSPVIVAFPHAVLAGNTYDTITLPHLIDLDTGNYIIKAYVTTPVDEFQGNDTATYPIDIRPALEVRVIGVTSQSSPIDAGWFVNQRLTIKNTGNVALSDIRIRLRVLVNAQTDTILEETLTGITIAAGDSLSNFILTDAYIVPWISIYGILVEVMGCDSAKIHASMYISEFVNTDDLELLRIDNPSGNGLDTIGSQIYVKITLYNNSMVNYFQGVKATVELKLPDGTLAGYPYGEIIPNNIPLAVDTSYTFTQAYTVPDDSVYTLTVFLTDIYGNPIDHFRTNDTARITRGTINSTIGIINMDRNAISMEQNIPNPATGTTRIDYSLPTDGEVTFHVYTISGQELLNKVVETTSGKHSIELNTTHLASGIYFYSMEFKGQRIVKRMSVSM